MRSGMGNTRIQMSVARLMAPVAYCMPLRWTHVNANGVPSGLTFVQLAFNGVHWKKNAKPNAILVAATNAVVALMAVRRAVPMKMRR